MSVHYLGLLGGPRGLVGHPQLEPEVKRAILASWASDRYAVRSRPALRKPPELLQPVPVGDVLDALKSLDAPQPDRDGETSDRSAVISHSSAVPQSDT